MARCQQRDSTGSQFFLMYKDSPHLEGQYIAFEKVIEGIEVFDMIAEASIGRQD